MGNKPESVTNGMREDRYILQRDFNIANIVLLGCPVKPAILGNIENNAHPPKKHNIWNSR